jgi:hypothetical protein
MHETQQWIIWLVRGVDTRIHGVLVSDSRACHGKTSTEDIPVSML